MMFSRVRLRLDGFALRMRVLGVAGVVSVLLAALASLTGAAVQAQSGANSQALAAQGNASSGRIPLEGAAAIVNDDAISRYDVRKRALFAMVTSGIRPTDDAFQKIAPQVLDTLIDEKLQLAEAKKRDVKVTEKDVDSSLADIAQSNSQTPEALVGELKKLGVDPSTFRDQLRADFAWQNLVQGRYGARIKVGESEMDAMMAQLKEAANHTQYLLSEIVVAYHGANDLQRATDFAQGLVDDIRNGAPLDVTAKRFSAAPTAAAGGDRGWSGEDTLRPEVAAIVRDMQLGDISKPIPTPAGIYIVVLRDKREGQRENKIVMLKQLVASVSPDTTDDQKADLLTRMNIARDRIKTCDDFTRAADGLADLVIVDLGENPVDQLKTEFQAAIAGLGANQTSQPFFTEGAVHLVTVCSVKSGESVRLPTRDEVENRLFNEQLQALARSYLRDLRRTAAIIRK